MDRKNCLKYFFHHDQWEDGEERYELYEFIMEIMENKTEEEKEWWEQGLPLNLFNLVVKHPYLLDPLMTWRETPQGQNFWANESVIWNQNGDVVLTPAALGVLKEWTGIEEEPVGEIRWV